jgi:hypothetical protein
LYLIASVKKIDKDESLSYASALVFCYRSLSAPRTTTAEYQ